MDFDEYKEMLQKTANDAAMYFRGMVPVHRVTNDFKGQVELTEGNMHYPCASVLIGARHDSSERIMRNEVILPLVDNLCKSPLFNNGQFVSIPMMPLIDNMYLDGVYKGIRIRLVKSYDMTALSSVMNVMMHLIRIN